MNTSKELKTVPEEPESVSAQNVPGNYSYSKTIELNKTKDFGYKKISPRRSNRSIYLSKCTAPNAKRNPVPLRCNPTAEAVLRERKVEIKDLESQVVYLQNRIKELKVENKTLVDIQNRQEKEMRKFKEGVADIPALLRSHKDEVRTLESAASLLRRELWDCQKDLKMKCDVILRKDQQLDKLNLVVKRVEKRLQEAGLEKRQLKLDNRRQEEEGKRLGAGHEELKSKTDRLQKKIQLMTSEILNFEEKLGTAEHFKAQLEDDLNKLQKKYDESLQNEIELRKSVHISSQTVSTQTCYKETVSVACMTSGSCFQYAERQEDTNHIVTNLQDSTCSSTATINSTKNCQSGGWPPDYLSSNLESRYKKNLLEPLNRTAPPSIKMLSQENDFDFGDHKGINLSNTILFNNFINSKTNPNNSYPNIFKTKDFHGIKEANPETKFSSPSETSFLPNESLKAKRKFSKFFTKKSCPPDELTSENNA